MKMLEKKKCAGAGLSNIWENIDGYVDSFRCAIALYVFSILLQFFNIIIDRGISSPLHGKEVVYGLHDT